MRKILFIGLATAALLFAACDSKSCKCYYYDGVNEPYAGTEYTDEGNACSSLDYSRNNNYRLCTEMSEPDIDPASIAWPYKKSQQ